jgi:hypothetical protein
MNEIAAIGLGAFIGLVSGLGLGTCFIYLLGCHQPEMQLITIVHTVLAMLVMGGWTVPSMLRRP